MQVQEEMRVAGKAAELGDDEDRAVSPAERQGSIQFRSIALSTALDLDDLGDQRPGAAV